MESRHGSMCSHVQQHPEESRPSFLACTGLASSVSPHLKSGLEMNSRALRRPAALAAPLSKCSREPGRPPSLLERSSRDLRAQASRSMKPAGGGLSRQHGTKHEVGKQHKAHYGCFPAMRTHVASRICNERVLA